MATHHDEISRVIRGSPRNCTPSPEDTRRTENLYRVPHCYKTAFMRQLSACLFFALLTSCAAKKGPDTKLDDVPGFCSEWASNACNDTVVKDCGTTTAACVQAQQTFCESIVPAAKYSSAEAPDCLKAVSAAYKDGQLTADERNTVLRIGNECAKILSGPGAADAACSADSDCDRSAGAVVHREEQHARGG